jgi:putative ABC transport system substrate-binding protein
LRALILLIAALLCAAPALAESLLIVQSNRDRSSTALQQSVTRTVKVPTEVLVLSDYAEVDLARVVREEQPDVILTIGESAFKATRKIRGVPVVAVLALSLGANERIPANVTGIDLRIDPARYMTIFKALGLKKIGVAYDPARSGAYIAKAQQAAVLAGIELIPRTVASPKEAVKNLVSLKGPAADSLWLIPDATVVTALTLEAHANYSLAQKKPLVSYTREHLKKGAAVALDLDWSQMGLQASDLVQRLFDGATPRELKVQSPQSFSLKSNEGVLKNLGFTPNLLDGLTFQPPY